MKILLTTDFSYGSLKAARYIIHLFGTDAVEYTLVNSANVKYAGGTFYQDFLSEIDAYHEKELVKVAAELVSEFQGLKIETHAEEGTLVGTLEKFDVNNKMQVIGLGANGSSNLYEKLIGSTALDIIDYAEIPVCVVPIVARIELPKRIMIAVSDPTKSLNGLSGIINGMQTSPTEIHLYHIAQGKNESLNQLKEDLSKAYNNITVYIHQVADSGASIENQILEFATEKRIELFITSPKNHNLIQRLFKHSVTRQLAERTHIPMIALKD